MCWAAGLTAVLLAVGWFLMCSGTIATLDLTERAGEGTWEGGKEGGREGGRGEKVEQD